MLKLAENLKLHHVGVAVESMDNSLALYKSLGYQCSNPVYDPLQNVYLASCKQSGKLIELIAPFNEKSPCNVFLKKSGPGPYYICYEVDSIKATKELIKKRDFHFRVVSPSKDTVLFNNARVCFCYVQKMGLIEFIEYRKKGIPFGSTK